MTLPRVVLCSMFRNDENRSLVDRVEHLLAKCECWPNLAYCWVVGDSTDGTTQALGELSTGYDNVQIVDIGSTGIEGDDAHSRLRRLSVTANEYWHWVDGADFVLIHESDIQSPYEIVNQLVAHAEQGRCPIAAWPTLEIRPGTKVFYDTLSYRKDGQMFSNHPPYHSCYKPHEVFEVDSAGTVMLFHGSDAKYLFLVDGGFLDLCQQLRHRGRTIYVDPQLEVIQPFALWQYHNLKEYA